MEYADKIIAYECGELNRDQIIELFQELVNSGLVWKLQGHYGRTAQYLIEQGYIKPKLNKRGCYDV